MLPVKSNHLLNVANNLKSLSFLYTLYILFFCGRVYSSWLGKKLGNFKCSVFLITSSSCISMSSQTLNLPYGLLWYTLRNRFMNMNPQSRESSINLSTLFFFFFPFMCVHLLPPTLKISLGFAQCEFITDPPLQCCWILNYSAFSPEPMETFRQNWNAYIERGEIEL